ncbi:MAG: ATP-binding protein [Fimbriimonas sp.]|nr:ATP-binding protein [Fimbriimonas sp.]
MSSPLGSLDLFDFAKIAVFPPKGLENLAEDDPIWTFNVGRRRDALYSVGDKASGEWNALLAEYLHDTGAYVESFGPANRARGIATETGNERLHVRALLSHVSSELSTGAFRPAKTHIDKVASIAGVTSDPYILGAHALLEAEFLLYGDAAPPDSLHPTIVLCRDASRWFEECGEFDLAVRARYHGANAIARTGAYIAAIRDIEAAMDFALSHDAWKYAGRLLQMAATAAADQGYRIGVEDATRKAIVWCQFVGDFWGRIQSIFALGRLISYTIPAGQPSQMAGPERYLRQAQEEAELHGATPLVVEIKNWLAWLENKCGVTAEPGVSTDDSVDADQQTRLNDLITRTSTVSRTIDLRISARLQDGVEDSPDPFYVFDSRRNEEGKCVDFLNEYRNPAGNRLLGLGPASVVMFSETLASPLFADLSGGLLNAVERREVFEDVREIGEAQTRRWYRRRIVPSGDGAILTLRDVTAENQIQEALRSAAELAEKSVRMQSDFLANMSHEIRTPINGVLGLARLLLEAPLSNVHRSYVEDIIGSGDILLRVIGNVLDLSRLESDNFEIDLAPVDLGDLVASTVRLYHGQAKEKGLRLAYSIDVSTPHTVMMDGARLRQVLANLIGNAVKFTPSGSVEVIVASLDGVVILEVNDTGMGIPDSRLEAIFERFQQATADSRSLGGSGLGLALAKGIIERMGGTIEVRSSCQQGSQFVVRIPMAEASQIPVEDQHAGSVQFEGKRVLLVDDNRVNTIVSEHALARVGCSVTVVSDGRQALSQMESEDFDIVFMDVRMPVMDGLEATRELRQREGSDARRVPVVALTAGALVEERDSCFAAGMDDYIAKPFTDEALLRVLVRWLT